MHPYDTDLTDDQWQLIEPLLPQPKSGGRPSTVNRRRVCDAVLYLVRTGCHWRAPPPRLPAVEYGLPLLSSLEERRYGEEGPRRPRETSATEEAEENLAVRGHHRQSVREDHGKRGVRGYDGGKNVCGRKRHLVVDTLGLIVGLLVHAANMQDRKGARFLLERAQSTLPNMKLLWADGGYGGQPFEDWVRTECGWRLEIVKRNEENAFRILPKRWIVERTFGWLNRYRRLSKDYEQLASTAETMIFFAMINLMVHRLAPE